jgi:POT family proton-dependent oligopeptide transporter
MATNDIDDKHIEVAALLPPSPKSAADEDVATNICEEEQLASLPDVCLSGDKDRPLSHITEKGEKFSYALKPMFFSVIFILMVELLERFSYYGIVYTQTMFLTGAYNEDWNAGFTSVKAASYVAMASAVAYTAPFLGAYLADVTLGDYNTILFGYTCLYLPGVFLLTLTTIPGLLGDEFNKSALAFALLVLWPLGTGVIKSVVNVFGAKQFHPLLQSSLIETYYVRFYMCINIGALIGGFLSPILAQHNITYSYGMCCVMLACALTMFLSGTPRYIRQKPTGSLFAKARPGQKTTSMFTIFRICILILPFSIAYSQMATTFVVQGTVMKRAFGFIDAASMNNADAISVLLFGFLIGGKLYPALNARGIKIPTTYKFAIGSMLGVLAIAWAIFVEYKIHAVYEATGEQISVLWQAGSYMLIGCGEIFAISTAYEAAFSAAPPEKKVLASAVNLFSYGSIPNMICIILYNVCAGWFRNSSGNMVITDIADYTTANVDKYFWTLLCVASLGIVVNVLPTVRDFVADAEQAASEAFRTPVFLRTPTRKKLPDPDEEEPMLDVKRHQAYLKYGTGPVLYKTGSLHTNPYGKDDDKKKRHLKKEQLNDLYGGKKKVVPPKGVMPPRNHSMKKQTGGHHRQQSM